MREEGTSLGGRAGEATRREARIALASAAGLYVVGGTLTATAVLLPHVSSPAGVVAVGLTAYLTAALLMLAFVASGAADMRGCESSGPITDADSSGAAATSAGDGAMMVAV